MALIRGWRGEDIEVASSGGGVLAVLNPWDNVVRAGVTPWPPPDSREVVLFRYTPGGWVDDGWVTGECGEWEEETYPTDARWQ